MREVSGLTAVDPNEISATEDDIITFNLKHRLGV